jgi:hypothetical protein
VGAQEAEPAGVCFCSKTGYWNCHPDAKCAGETQGVRMSSSTEETLIDYMRGGDEEEGG